MKMYIFPFVAGIVLICACSRQDESQHSRPEKPERVTDSGRYTDLRPDAILVRIGTNVITRVDFDKIVDLRAKIIKMTLPPNMQENAINVSAVRMPLLARLCETYRMQTALLNWAAENDLQPSEEEISKFQEGFMAGCKRPRSDFRKFVKKNFTADEARTINERVHIEAVCDKAKRHYIASNSNKVDKVDVDAYIKRVENYNRTASATNALVWAKATNLWQMVVNEGADFAELSDRYSEDAGHTPGGNWGTFRYEDLANDGLLDKTVAALEVGGVSAPIEADNGLNILKLVNVVDSRGEPVVGSRDGDVSYEIARIFLRLPEIYEIPPREEAAKQIHEAAQNRAFRQFVEKLIENDGAEYPSGTVIFDRAKQSLSMPAMLMQQGVTQEKLDAVSTKEGRR